MFVLLMNSSYTANLAAFLTVSNIDKSINSVEDLISQSVFSYGTYKKTKFDKAMLLMDRLGTKLILKNRWYRKHIACGKVKLKKSYIKERIVFFFFSR